MKKIFCILLVLLMLTSMGGCQVVNAATPAAEAEQKNDAPAAEPEAAEPAPTAQPVLIPMEEVVEEKPYGSINSDAEAERIGRKHFAEAWPGKEFDPKYDIEPYRYACEMRLDDICFDFDKENIPILDIAPYNMHAGEHGTSDMTQFMTNKQLVEKLGYDKVTKYADLAGALLDNYTMYDPDYPVEKRKADFAECATSELAEVLANRTRTSSKAAWFKQDTCTFWYPTYVYRASDGWLRARMQIAIILRNASDAFFAEHPDQRETVGRWHIHTFEVAMQLDDNEKIAEYAVFELGVGMEAYPDEAERLDDFFNS
ncbi:MAG: hypothetical protein Q4E65_01605 [Clostridia bacterium]|nr:hypothetical protein [Clostridia bacterium]